MTHHQPLPPRTAPELRVEHWIDGAGEPRQPLRLAELAFGYKVIYCFQHWCRGCHSTGFPALLALRDAVMSHGIDVGFAVVQTVFEGAETNTRERLREMQHRYRLPVPFGHDEVAGGGLPTVMQDYQTGGTPWFLVIDRSGHLIHSDYRIDVARALELFVAGDPPPLTDDPAAPPRWSTVLRWARKGNLAPPRRVELADDQWRARLSEDEYRITRQHGTERRFSSDACTLFAPGRYRCVGCGTDLFDSSSKFNSRTGWPSFTQPVAPGVVAYHADDSHGMQRIEVACNICDAHLGHVFPDGPDPTGLRYCMNGIALRRIRSAE